MNAKTIIATVLAITAVLFVVPVNADLVAVDNNRLFVAFTGDPSAGTNCPTAGIQLFSGANFSGTQVTVSASGNLLSDNFDNKTQSLRIQQDTTGAMGSTWAICMDDDYQECWKLEQSDFSCDGDYCSISDLGSFLNGSANNNISSVAMLSCPGIAVDRASSATISISLDKPNSDIGVPMASAIVGSVYENVTGSVSNTRTSPWDSTTISNGAYTAVLNNAMAKYILPSPNNRLTFLWGSIETNNIIQFYRNGLPTGELIVGQDAIDAGAPEATGLSVATITTDSLFDEVRFISSNDTFEYANLRFE